MKCEIKDGILHIEMPVQTPVPSSSGKTMIVASTHGGANSGVVVAGQPLTVSVNAYIPSPKE